MKKNITITFGRKEEEYVPKKSKQNKQFGARFRNEGFVLKSYDATYEKTMFELFEHDDVIEVEELNSGMRFIVIKKGVK